MGLLAIALIVDWWVGDPNWLWRKIKHPVVWFGGLIDLFDNRSADWTARGRFLAGLMLLGALLGISLMAGAVVARLAAFNTLAATVLELVLVVIFIAQKSLRDHVLAVANALRDGGVEGGREAVSKIVGRDVSELDESGVSKAAIESLAENYSDGIVAPAFWYALLGIPGIVFYKAVNTADSMVGHRTEKHEQFGKPAAILDDWMNWVPARLSALMVAAVRVFQGSFKRAGEIWTTTTADAPSHRSPNAGWPETAFAAALDISLGGNRTYGDESVEAKVLNEKGKSVLNSDDIDRALSLFSSVCFLGLVFVVLFWFFISGRPNFL